MYYLYRFLDEDYNILYVGRTNNLENRINQHFSFNGHIEKSCYEKVKKIEYVELKSQFDMVLKEIYYINKFLPPYNKRHVYENEKSEIILDFTDNWIDYNMKNIKFKKHPVTSKSRNSVFEELPDSGLERKIKMVLVSKGKTFKELSLEMGVDPKSLLNKLRTESIRTSELVQIADILGVALEIKFVTKDGTKI